MEMKVHADPEKANDDDCSLVSSNLTTICSITITRLTTAINYIDNFQ